MENKEVRIVFMGTPSFAVPSLSALLDAGYNVAGVVTAPDKAAGRGRKISISPVKEYALLKDIPVLQPVSLKSSVFVEQLKNLDAGLQVVVAFRMLPEIVWGMPRLGTFNLHASLLPQYRGAAPINHAIMRGEKVTGLTTFFLDKEIDTGKIIHQVKIPIGDDEDFGHLHDRMMEAGAKLVVKTVDDIIHGQLNPVPQTELYAEDAILHPAPKLSKDGCRINWNDDIRQIHNFIRGLSPYPAAFTLLRLQDEKQYVMKIFRAVAEPFAHNKPYGHFVTDGKSFLKVYARNGNIRLLEIQFQGKKRMSVDDFLRGFNLNKARQFE